MVRGCQTQADVYELAYGHHRIEALKQLDIKKLTVVVQALSNDAMLQMMANENSEEYGHDFSLGVMNAVEAVIKGYAAGSIELEEPERKRYFAGPQNTKPYTADTVAKFLGWQLANGAPQPRVFISLNALELLERKVLSRQQLRGLGLSQVKDLLTLCKRREAAEAEKLETQHNFLRQQAAAAQKANDVNKLRSVEKKLVELEAEAPKAIVKAGKEAISAVKEFYDPEQGMAAALRAAAEKLKIEAPKAAAPKAPRVVDLSNVDNFAAQLDTVLRDDDLRWEKILELAANTKAKKTFRELEASLMRLGVRTSKRMSALRKVID